MADLDKLSPAEAYSVMLHFLEGYYERTHGEEIAAMLGGLAINEDGSPIDPAAWDDWLGAIEQV